MSETNSRAERAFDSLRNLKAAARMALTYMENYERGCFIPADSVHQPGPVITRLRNALNRADAKSVQPTQSVGQDAEAPPRKQPDPRTCL